MKTFSCQCCGVTKSTNHQSTNTYCSSECSQAAQRAKRTASVEAGEASAGRVKLYLLEKHGNVCQDVDCAWDMMKRPIKVELEHIDGNSQNNQLSNCKLICPNCHSLTPTYKNKNKGNGRAERRARYKAGLSY